MKQKQLVKISVFEAKNLIEFIEKFDWNNSRVPEEHRREFKQSSEALRGILSKNKSFLHRAAPFTSVSLRLNPSDLKTIKTMAIFSDTCSSIKFDLNRLIRLRKSRETPLNFSKEASYTPLINIIVRTSNRPNFFRDCKHCVFDEYSYGDYRVANNLFMRIPKKEFINLPLVSLQGNVGNGLRQDKVLSQITNNHE